MVEKTHISKSLRWFSRIDQILHRLPATRLRAAAMRWSRRLLAVMRPAGQIHIRTAIPRPNDIAQSCITVLSANLWHDWPFRRRLSHRLESFARLVEAEDADIVLLQEVFRTPQLLADEWLADRLGMAYSYSRANGDEQAIGFEEGLAIFSRFPIAKPQTRHLGLRSGVTRRLALASEVQSPIGNFLAISVHLGFFQKRNRSQLRDLFGWVGNIAHGRTALIGGDFNAHETSSQISKAQKSWVDTFRTLNPEADGTTFELQLPWGSSLVRRRFDYIFLRQGFADWRVMDARHVESAGLPHSDHSAVLARLQPRRLHGGCDSVE